MKERKLFLTDEERGIDPTSIPCNDCSRIQNPPLSGKIPEWWLEEGTPEQVEKWQKELNSGNLSIEK